MRTKLLLADDSITIQKVVGIIFASEDYELAIVDNGTAALARAREFKPDLLLVDAVMPGKTGYEVCEEVRRDPDLTGVPILLLTGAFEAFDDEKARKCGADDFISKPFESQHLIDKVTELVDLGRQRAAAAPAPALEAAAPAPTAQPVPHMPAPVSPMPQPAPSFAAPAEQPVAERPDIFDMDVVPALRPAPTAAPTPAPDFELEMVEGTADDDLWGAFDLEDVSDGEAAEFDESAFAVEPLAEGVSITEEAFGFAEEAGVPPQVSEDSGEGSAALWDIEEDSGFSFAEEAPPVFAPVSDEPEEFIFESAGTAQQDLGDIMTYAPPAEHEFDLQSAPEEEFTPAPELLESPATIPPLSVDSGFDFQFASGEEFLPAAESQAEFTTPSASGYAPHEEAPEPIFAPDDEFVPASEALAPVAAPVAPAAAAAALSEEQLAALVSRISRDIIEKIAWEVVPDLAETIIKDEIRKIKEGA